MVASTDAALRCVRASALRSGCLITQPMLRYHVKRLYTVRSFRELLLRADMVAVHVHRPPVGRNIGIAPPGRCPIDLPNRLSAGFIA